MGELQRLLKTFVGQGIELFSANEFHGFRDKVTLVPLGPENMHTDTFTPNENATVLFYENGVSMIVTGYGENWLGYYAAKVYLFNSTDKNVMFSVEDVSVNGFMCDPFWANSLPPKSQCLGEIYWNKDKFEENGITSVEEIEMKVRVYDDNDWMADSLYENVVVLKP